MTDEEFKQQQDERKRKRAIKQKKERRRRTARFILIIVIIIAIIMAGLYALKNVVGIDLDKILRLPQKPDIEMTSVEPEETKPETEETESVPDTALEEPQPDTETQDTAPSKDAPHFEATDSTVYMDTDQLLSSYAILVNADTGEIVAQKEADAVISPASMTKILTVLVSAEQLSKDQMNDTAIFTAEMSDYCYEHECSVVGYSIDEEASVDELFYGTILPSGADAALALANYVGGDLDHFSDLMNAKCEELGISETAHFTNPVGVYSEDLHCTVNDMAVILYAAMQNPVAADALSAHTYTLAQPNDTTPDGILSNWFLRRIEDKECGGVVVAAKTGFVQESGFCAASYFTADDGTNYICVTGANPMSTWGSIYDHVAIYNIYATGNTEWRRPSDQFLPPPEEENTDGETSDTETTDSAE